MVRLSGKTIFVASVLTITTSSQVRIEMAPCDTLQYAPVRVLRCHTSCDNLSRVGHYNVRLGPEFGKCTCFELSCL